MVATATCISEDLKNFISTIQENLKKEIQQHNITFNKLKQDPKNSELESRLKQIQSSINQIAEEQQFAVHCIKLEVKEYGKKIQNNGVSHAVMGRATNLNNAVRLASSKLKKSPSFSGTSPSSPLQPVTSTSEDVVEETPVVSEESSSDVSSSHSLEPPNNPIELNDFTQAQFLKYFGIVTHAVHDEMQKKRVERKRRSTANPQFFYGTKWDLPVKRKRSLYLASNISPPVTRQAAKKKAEKAIISLSKDSSVATSPPATVSLDASSPFVASQGAASLSTTSTSTALQSSAPEDAIAQCVISAIEQDATISPVDSAKLSMPKLPFGLTIERVDPARSTPDPKICIVCRLPGGRVFVCESCMNGFHISCHNRPLVQQPRKCPKCIVTTEVRTLGNLNVPSDMSVSYKSTIDLTEKLHEKQKLLVDNKTLADELIKLKDQHSHLAVSFKEQQVSQEELLLSLHLTENKIQNLLQFVNSMKSSVVLR